MKHFVSNSTESKRMFRSDFLEMFSKVHFSVPIIIYVPVIIYFLIQSFNARIAWYNILLLFCSGVFIWSFTEYVLHRFVFHFKPASRLGERIHFIFHGVHHDYPNDLRRLVMPPSVSIPLAMLFYFIFRLALGDVLISAFFPGFVAGYLFYDITHYALHHFNFKSRVWMRLKRFHMLHHYKDSKQGFGVSSGIWDRVFKTGF